MNRLAVALIAVTSIASVVSALTIFMAMNGFRSHLPKPPSGANGTNFPQQIFGQQQTASSPSNSPALPFGP